MTETKELRGLIQNKIIKYLDSLTIYVYIVHYSFLRGVFAVDKMMNVYVIWIPLFFGITIVSAMLLEKICSKVIGRIQTCS